MTVEFEPGKRWTDETNGIRYEVCGVEVNYVLSITHITPDGDETHTERVRYPQEALKRKVEEDDLTPAVKEADDSDASESHVCDKCGEAFPTPQALAGHMGKHNDDSDDE